MRRSPEQLAGSLARGLAPVYLITGDEPMQRMECADAVRAAARSQGYDERLVFDSSAGIDWSQLRFQADSLSLFASRRLIELRLHEPKVGSEGGEALRDYCAHPAEDTILLISAPKFDGRGQAAEWFKAIERTGDVVAVWPLKADEMPRWIGQRLRNAGLQATPEAIRLMADRVEGNLLAAVQDVEKLALLAAGREIDVDTVLSAVGDSARFDLFALADTALSGDAARAVRMLRGLRDEGAEPVLVCWSLVRELRAACALGGNGRPEALMPGYRLFGPREGILRRAAQRLGVGALRRLLREATRIDRVAKGALAGDVWDDLTALCMAIAGKPLGAFA